LRSCLNKTRTGQTTGLSIFKDREKLSPRYVPSSLLHRDGQMQEISNFLKGAVIDPSKTFLKPLQIIGPAGTGKTSTILRFGQTFVNEARKNGVSAQHVYVNLKLQGGSKVVLYRFLLQNATPEVYSSSLSAEEMLRVMLQQLQESKKYLLITLDEIDYFVKSTKDTSVVYDLTRLNEISPEKPCNVLGVIFIARSKEFREKLDRAELSTLGRIAIEFAPYRPSEIRDILEARSEEAFNPGVVSEEVLEYIADLTVSPPVSGDLRYALDLLLYAGTLAENQSSDGILPDHVRRVYGEIHPSITEEDILDLAKKEQLLALLAVVRSLKGNKAPYASMKEVRLNSQVMCEEMKQKPIEDLEEYVQDLCDRGLVEIRSLREIGISGAPSENLEKYLDTLLRRIQVGLNQ
jgi:cell division control protein 6